MTTSFVMCVRPSAWNNSAPTWRIFMKFDIKIFFENISRNSDQDVDGRIILRWIFRKWEGVVGTGWIWLRMGRGGGRL